MNLTIPDVVLVALISAFVTLVPKLVEGYTAHRRLPIETAALEAEAAAKLTGAAATFADDLLARVASLREQVEKLEQRNRELEGDLLRLRQDLMEAQSRIGKLERENTTLRQCNAVLTAKVNKLRKLLIDYGIQHTEEAEGGEDTGGA